MKSVFSGMAVIGLGLVLAMTMAVYASPVQAQNCLICWETMEGEVKKHAFVEGSEVLCNNPELNNEDCAACGLTSDCHFEWDDGPCHESCGGATVARLHREVENWLDTRPIAGGGPQLFVSREPGNHLVLDPQAWALELRDCEGKVVTTWAVPSSHWRLLVVAEA